MAIAYSPTAQFQYNVSDVEFRRIPSRVLMATVYQPQGTGPFPVILDLHGGAWNFKDRSANHLMCEALAASGMVVAAVDLTLGTEAPYPASVQDANLGVRWLKLKAAEWKGDASTIGMLGSSSGGHVAELVAMRPRDARYNALPLAGGAGIDATVNYVATRSPISDPLARYEHAVKNDRELLVERSKTYFNPWEAISEGNPQHILDRGEAVTLPPLLVMQGSLDANVPQPLQEKFVASYRKAGGDCHLEMFEGCEHMWIHDPGPQTTRAHDVLKAFIARQLQKMRLAA